MRKKLALALTFALVAVLLAGCVANLTVGDDPFQEKGDSSAEDSLKTGLAVLTGLTSSGDAVGGEPGLAQVDSTVVAVLVDGKGVIVDCKIDAVQSKMRFDAAGKLETPLDTRFATKNELGTAYNMLEVSGIGKEWNEQAAALAGYVVGKTLGEVKGVAIDETTRPTEPELAASVTISIGSFIPAIEQAVNTAQALGARAGDRLGVGVDTHMSESSHASPEEDGQARAYSTYAAVSFDSGGEITSCILDGSQGVVAFDAQGRITSDLAVAVKTKNELGTGYGMKKNSDIRKEWREQAAAFAAYATGKTAAEVAGIAVDGSDRPSHAELATSVTISVGGFCTVLEKASVNAADSR